MIANKNSWHAKLYQFTYSDGLPNNLCPYFWKLLWALIVFIPTLVLNLPSIILNLFIDYSKGETPNIYRRSSVLLWMIIFVSSIILYSNYELIRALLGLFSYNYKAVNIGLVIDTLILILVVAILVKSAKEKIDKPKTDNIVIEFIKAKYNNYCPKIDWK